MKKIKSVYMKFEASCRSCGLIAKASKYEDIVGLSKEHLEKHRVTIVDTTIIDLIDMHLP